MRIPLARFGGDQRPVAKWEWIFAPIVLPITILSLCVLALISIPYYWLYPEFHTHDIDLNGTSEEKAHLKAIRDYRMKVSIFRRLLERLHISPLDLPPELAEPLSAKLK